MNPVKKTINETAEGIKFRDGEHLWFWFLNQKRIFAGFGMPHAHNRHAITPLDIETLITRLYLAGRLTDAMLSVMQEFGARRRAPNQHVYAENKSAALWNDAMAKIESAARERGWME